LNEPARMNSPFPRKTLERLGCVNEKRQAKNYGWPDRGYVH
jgi:hypothetical protein